MTSINLELDAFHDQNLCLHLRGTDKKMKPKFSKTWEKVIVSKVKKKQLNISGPAKNCFMRVLILTLFSR